MKPATRARPAPRETQPLNVQPLNTRFITLYGDDLHSDTKAGINKLLQGSKLLPQFIDASALSATDAVRQATAELPKNGHLLVHVHGKNGIFDGRAIHYLCLRENNFPCITTESLVKTVVDQLGIEPGRIDQPGKGLPFIYLFTCYSGEFRHQINPGSDLWKRANLLIFAGSHETSLLSSGNSVAGAIAYVDHCQRHLQEVDPLKLFFFAGMHRGDCISLMGGKLTAPLVWHAPKSGLDQGRIDNVSGAPEDKQRFERTVAALRPVEYRLLPAASLTEVVCNRIARDDADRLRDLLAAHPELRDLPATGCELSPLGFAAESSASNCLLALLEAGADPEKLNGDGVTPLMAAVTFENYKLINVNILLDHGANPDSRSPDGWTALMLASRAGRTEAVQALLARGADPALQTNNGESALMLACKNRHTEVARALLESGANPDIQDENGMTPLMRAVKDADFSLQSLLLEHGADPDVPDHSRSDNALRLAIQLFDTKALKPLLDANANPDWQNKAGSTALMLACLFTNRDAVRLLLDAGANPNLQTNGGLTALMLATKFRDTTLMKMLLEQGARTDLFSRDGYSCLNDAVRTNQPDVLRLLLAFGAGPASGLNPQLLDEAIARGYQDVARMLQSALAAFNETQ